MKTIKQIKIAGLLMLCALFLVAPTIRKAGAQGSPATPTPAVAPTPMPASSSAPAPSLAPKVIALEGHLELDEIVVVEVDHFSEWAATHDATKLVPFINGRAVRGNYPEEIHPDRNRLHFHLEIKPQNKELWNDLLGAPHGLSHSVTFTIGL